MIVKEAKKLWAGRAWIHGKYLNQCVREKAPLRIVHDGHTMTIPYDTFKEVFDRDKLVFDRFTQTEVKQYGVVWSPDK